MIICVHLCSSVVHSLFLWPGRCSSVVRLHIFPLAKKLAEDFAGMLLPSNEN